MRHRILLAVLLLAAFAQAQQPADVVVERLARVGQFAFGGVGIAGTTSPGEKDYKAVLVRSTAMADFERLLSIGNPQAKAYALVGIRTINPKRYRTLSPRFLDSKENVSILRGCLVSTESLPSVLKQIEDGQYSLGK